MQASGECIPCVIHQALNAARRITDDPWLHRKLLFAVMEYLPTINFDRTPAEISYDCIRFTEKYLGVPDPFKRDKQRFADTMLAIEHDMRRKILESDDPLFEAIRYALAGNMIDLGIAEADHVEEQFARDASSLELAINHYDALRSALDGARSALYVLDNAGEAVCDKLVIEQLGVPEVTCVVRRAPIINDVTREDAEAVGLNRLGKIVDIGADALGVPLSRCSAEFRDLFRRADVVISKGQANFETLDEADREVHHLLRAKCAHLAGHLGVPRGSAVLIRTPSDTKQGGQAIGETTRGNARR